MLCEIMIVSRARHMLLCSGNELYGIIVARMPVMVNVYTATDVSHLQARMLIIFSTNQCVRSWTCR